MTIQMILVNTDAYRNWFSHHRIPKSTRKEGIKGTRRTTPKFTDKVTNNPQHCKRTRGKRKLRIYCHKGKM